MLVPTTGTIFCPVCGTRSGDAHIAGRIIHRIDSSPHRARLDSVGRTYFRATVAASNGARPARSASFPSILSRPTRNLGRSAACCALAAGTRYINSSRSETNPSCQLAWREHAPRAWGQNGSYFPLAERILPVLCPSLGSISNVLGTCARVEIFHQFVE